MNLIIAWRDRKSDYYSDYERPRIEIFRFYFDFKNLKSVLTKFAWKIPSLEELYSAYKPRLYGVVGDEDLVWRYGTVSRNAFGDKRNAWQKMLDNISDIFENRREKKRLVNNYNVGWSFFDYCFGKKITNMGEIHELEKKSGRVFMSWKEREVEQAKAEKLCEERMKEKIRKKLHHVFSEVQRGRRYTEEVRRAKEDMMRSFH